MEYRKYKEIKKEEFLEMVKKGLEQHFTGCSFDICSTVKNNGQKRMGITMREPGRCANPVIYMENEHQEFESGRPFQDILTGICMKFEDSRPADFDGDEILDFSRAKNRIFFHLINVRENEDVLQKMPHRIWNDLAVIYSLLAAAEGEWTASMPVKDAMLEQWGVDEETLHIYAQKNTPRLFRGYFRPMGDVLSDMLGIPAPQTPDEIPMYLAGNSRQYLGSSVVLYQGFLARFAEKTGGSFYILPSSIHELLFLPCAAGMDRSPLLQMVREINRTQVAPEEVLSDNIYLYHADTGDVEMIADASGSGYAPGKEKIVCGVF